MHDGEAQQSWQTRLTNFSLQYMFACCVAAVMLLILLILPRSNGTSLIDFLLPFTKLNSDLSVDNVATVYYLFSFIGRYIPLMVASPALVTAIIGVTHTNSSKGRRFGLISLGLFVAFGSRGRSCGVFLVLCGWPSHEIERQKSNLRYHIATLHKYKEGCVLGKDSSRGATGGERASIIQAVHGMT